MGESCRVLIGGDFFPTQCNIESFNSGNISEVLGSRLLSLISNVDYCVCNLEGALTDSDCAAIKAGGPLIKAPISAIRGIKETGIHCFNLANNHVTDYGSQGFSETVNALEGVGINWFGAGRTDACLKKCVRVNKNGVVFAIYGVAEEYFNAPDSTSAGVNIYDELSICAELSELKKNCDCVIVLYHGGPEFFRYPSPQIVERFHRMADSGADVVISQHSHCVGVAERYRNANLLYGQGELLLIRGSKTTLKDTGLLVDVTITQNNCRIEYLPIIRSSNKVELCDDASSVMEDFRQRCDRMASGDDFVCEYEDFVDGWMTRYLESMRGKNIIDRLLRKLLPETAYRRYIVGRYTRRQLLTILYYVRCHEHREPLIDGLWRMAMGKGGGSNVEGR